MNKSLSFAALLAALFSAAPAEAAVNFGGYAGLRLRDENYSGTAFSQGSSRAASDLMWQYRVRLFASADLGDGYYFKAMATDETEGDGGWNTVTGSETYNLQVSNFSFGRQTADNGYAIGRLPLNAVNTPILDLTLFPFQPLESPLASVGMDRLFGVNYNTRFLAGNLRASLFVLDNGSANNTGLEGDGKFNDGYALYLSYSDKVGDITVEPQFIRAVTQTSLPMHYPYTSSWYTHVTPWSAGASLTVPAGGAKIGLGAFYTRGRNSTGYSGINGFTDEPNAGDVDYSGYQIRIKGDYGPVRCYWDYHRTTDKSRTLASEAKYTNNFFWLSYEIPVHKTSSASFTIQPTLRYLTNKAEGGVTNVNQQRLRTDLWATVTF
ncbi:MAG: porin [Chlorobiaceae bacterium]|nr:porin [Chlorobiaceae bacterium]